MTRGSIREYTEAVRERYLWVSKMEKGKILDEFSKVTGYHRNITISSALRELLRYCNLLETKNLIGEPQG